MAARNSACTDCFGDTAWFEDKAPSQYTIKAASPANKCAPLRKLYPLLDYSFMLVGSFKDVESIQQHLRGLGARLLPDTVSKPPNKDVVVALGQDAASDPGYAKACSIGCHILEEDGLYSVFLSPETLPLALMDLPSAPTAVPLMSNPPEQQQLAATTPLPKPATCSNPTIPQTQPTTQQTFPLQGHTFLLLGRTTQQQSHELGALGATVLTPTLHATILPTSRDIIIIAGPGAIADPAYRAAQILGCSMLDEDGLSAVLQHPSYLQNFLTAIPTPPSSTNKEDQGPPVSQEPSAGLVQQQQQQESAGHDSLAAVTNTSCLPSSTQEQQHQHQQKEGVSNTQQDLILSGCTFIFLGTSKVINYRNKLFTLQHWQQQLEQLGATVILPPQSSSADATTATAGVNSADAILVLTSSTTSACAASSAGSWVGCMALDVAGLIAVLEDPSQLPQLLIKIPAAAAAALGPTAKAGAASISVAQPATTGAAVGSMQQGKQHRGNITQEARPEQQTAAGLQTGSGVQLQQQQQQEEEAGQRVGALHGRTFMFVGAFKKRNSIINKLKYHGAQLVWTPEHDRFGPHVIVVAGGAAAAMPQYAAAHQLGCKMLSKKWLRVLVDCPEQLDSLLEDMAVPAAAAAGHQQGKSYSEGLDAGPAAQAIASPAKDKATKSQQQQGQQQQGGASPRVKKQWRAKKAGQQQQQGQQGSVQEQQLAKQHAPWAPSTVGSGQRSDFEAAAAGSRDGDAAGVLAAAAVATTTPTAQKEQQQGNSTKKPKRRRRRSRNAITGQKDNLQELTNVGAGTVGLSQPSRRSGPAAQHARTAGAVGGSDSEESEGVEWAYKYAAVYCSQEMSAVEQ